MSSIKYTGDNKPFNLNDRYWHEPLNDPNNDPLPKPPENNSTRFNNVLSSKYGGAWLDYASEGKWETVKITDGATIFEINMQTKLGDKLRLFCLNHEIIKDYLNTFLAQDYISIEIKKFKENEETYHRE